MPTENPREPWTMPEPARSAEPETTPIEDANRTAPHQPTAAPRTTVEAAVPLVLHDASVPEVPGYQVTGEIARGGMGVVYAARDVTLNRAVAIKTVLPELAGRADLVALFVREAGITARLPHPGVPPVHVGGTLADGRPFLAMKLIRGRTLADELANTDRVATLPRLLGVFEGVCQAVGYAHSEGIIHRDLKPGNVMVGAFGEVQVMDWGLARTLACGGRQPAVPGVFAEQAAPAHSPDATQAGSAKGTPAYMPPEQARGEWDKVDARADVFALGGILCVLLTGRAPYGGKNGLEVLKRAKAAELSSALAALDACGADTELIDLCKHCLAPNPSDRLSDARSVAEAVAAYRVGVEERARKAETQRAAAEAEAREQRKRRKVQLALLAAVVTILGLLAAGAWYENSQAQKREFARAQDERDRGARQENGRVIERLIAVSEKALREDDDPDGAERELKDAQSRVPLGGAEHLAGRIARCAADLAALRKLHKTEESLWTPVGNRTPTQEEAAAMWAEAFREVGITPGQTPPKTAAERIKASHIKEQLLAAVELWWALFSKTPQWVRDVLREADSDAYRETVRDASRSPNPAELPNLLAKPEGLTQPPRFAAAMAQVPGLSVKLSVQILGEARRRDPRNFAAVMALASPIPNDSREARANRVGYALAAVTLRPKNPNAWNTLAGARFMLADLGGENWNADVLEGALAAADEAIRLEPRFAAAHTNRGIILNHKNDFPGAVAAFQAAIRLEPNYALAHANLGDALHRTGDLDGAVTEYREAIRLDPALPMPRLHLGFALHDKNDLDGAITAYREALKLVPKHAPTQMGLGDALKARGDLVGAANAYREATKLTPKDPNAHFQLGLVLYRSNKLPEAIAAYKAALAINPNHAQAQTQLGMALSQTDDLKGAIAELEKALKLDARQPLVHSNLGGLYLEVGQTAKGIAAAREAIRLDPKLSPGHAILGLGLQQAGDLPGARAAFTDAARLDPKQWGHLLKQLPPLTVAPAPREVKR